MLVSAIGALSTFYPEAKEIDDPESSQQADHPPDRQGADAGRGLPPLQRGHAVRVPRQLADFTENFLSMMWKVAEPRYEADPVLARALDVLFILHADHEQNCGTPPCAPSVRRTPTPTRPRRPRRPRSTAPATAAPTRRSCACSTEIGSIDNVPAFIDGQGGQGKLQGFGHRVYKNYDPRATIIKKTADEVFEVDGQEPAPRHRPEAGRGRPLRRLLHFPASSTPTWTSTPGSIYQAMNFPTTMFTVLFAIPQGVGLAGALAGDDRAGRQDLPTPPDLDRPRGARVRPAAKRR